MTERLVLRRTALRDSVAIYEEYATDPEVTRYLTWRPHSSPENLPVFLRGLVARWDSREEFSWVITLGNRDHAVGMLNARIRGHMVDLGYVLGRRHWKQGYMTEAVATLVKWAFGQPDVFRIWATCDVDNVPSARVLEKSRFQREGILRRWIIHPNVSAQPRDCYVYAQVR